MIVDCALYEGGLRQTGDLSLAEAARSCRRDGAFVWLGLYEPSAEEFDKVRHEFALHELAAEDAIKAHQRPKIEVYGESLFVVLKSARYIDETESVEFGEIQVFVGKDFAIVVRHGEASSLGETRKRMEARPDLLAHGPSAVLYGVMDRVVDDYAPVALGLDDDIREVELQVFAEGNDTGNPVERIYKLKREVLDMLQATSPLLEPLQLLANGDVPWIVPESHAYFRDVHDHLRRVKDRIDTFSQLLTSVLEANLTRVSVRQNEDMRKISAWVAIAAVPTMIAGIYGMNFEHMPELGSAFGYPAVLGFIFVVCFLLYRAFRRSGWL
ncbi:MAG TPA: magnesium and cobalt transport protein CorA [Acidimicrobiia bacterium]|nr:magnesium and cobalt transport protein CorA [Acidimicrobiia bacterium]